MNLGRISVKRIFLLVSGGMAVSMLAICAVFFVVTGQMWILACGILLTFCALVWMFLLSIAFSKRLSVFTRELCRAMDQMISGSGEPVRAADSETLFARISYRLSRLYETMQENRRKASGERQELQRCSDDGEPQGTAGRPMLEVLLGEGIHNAAVVVTRYFGGTLLGTGGLVRAYSKAVQAGLKASVIIEKQQGFLLKLETDYNGIGKIQYILGQRGIVITDSEYTEKVKVETLVPQELLDGIREEITEGTNGKAVFLACSPVCFALVDGAPVIFA